MESHVINMYHQAPYRNIGHKVMHSTSNSMSSESSNQNSPEYQIQTFRQGYSIQPDWRIENNQNNATQSSHDTSSEDEEENIEVVEVPHIDEEYDSATEENYEDCSLVEGTDYDIIQVYTVDPNLILDNEVEEHMKVDENSSDHSYDRPVNRHPDVIHEDMNKNCNAPVVSNVDEYFVKDTKNVLVTRDEPIVKDDPVVKDVNEYFINELKTSTPTIDPYFVTHTMRSCRPFATVPETCPDNFLADSKEDIDEADIEGEPEQENAEVPINELDLEGLPNIDDLKKYILGDTPGPKQKHPQRSFSVPQSPMNISVDIDEAKTRFSLEDLDQDIDFTDLAFHNDKDKLGNNARKNEDIPFSLTDDVIDSFINNKIEAIIKNEDDLSTQDMEIEQPLESNIKCIERFPGFQPEIKRTSTPIPKPAVLEYCIEKSAVKTEPVLNIKTEIDDFVDVESCNDNIIPVLEANNLSSLLEQFEATEKLNIKKINEEDKKVKTIPKTSLTNGTRIQDAGVQLNKHKMRQILMPPTTKSAKRTTSPIRSDHDYCSSKKRQSLPNIKKGQSLLKPEVLSSNNKILNSRHRSCKSKKIDYHLSSDEESEKLSNKNKKQVKNNRDDSDTKTKKTSGKQIVKLETSVVLPVERKKLSNGKVAIDSSVNDNNSVINKSACKASDNLSSQNSTSIKLTIKNKCKVIINCDDKDSHKDIKSIVKQETSSVSDKTSNRVQDKSVKEIINTKDKDVKSLDKNKNKNVNKSKSVCDNVEIKQEVKQKDDNFYTALFSNKQDVQVPQPIQVKSEKLLFEQELQRISEETIKKEMVAPKKKKLNLQEYKMRKINSNNSSATVSPESIFPDMPQLNLDKAVKPIIINSKSIIRPLRTEQPRDVFDPIREASRKIIMITKKQKAEALRKRDEDIVKSKIPKVENLELQPLMTDAEMMKMVGITPAEELPIPIVTPATASGQLHKLRTISDYEEIVLVSVGTNTDEEIFDQLEKSAKTADLKRKLNSPTADAKSLINFKIKKNDHVLRKNVFDADKKDKRSPVDENKHEEKKIDKKRFKDITAALKRVEKQVHKKISSNSLFACIQDAVLKKAPEESERKYSKPSSPTEEKTNLKCSKTTIIRTYDTKVDHGEDKIILHLERNRLKPVATNAMSQTDEPECAQVSFLSAQMKEKAVIRKRNDSDMSMSSDSGSPVRTNQIITSVRHCNKVAVKPKEQIRPEKRSLSKEKRSKSKERHDRYRRRSRSSSRGRRRRCYSRSRSRSKGRSRSRSRGRYHRYRRSDSPYKRKRTSRSPYNRRSSPRRSEKRSDRTNRPRTPRRVDSSPGRGPAPKKAKLSPLINEKAQSMSMTPPLRKQSISETSEASSSTSSSASSSSSSAGSRKSDRASCSSYNRKETYRPKYISYSSEDRENDTPVEQRKIVFVGKLEKDVNKTTLRGMFSKFGPIVEVRIHSKEDGTRYGFVTYQHATDAWTAVESASTFPQYDVGFGGRRAFCRNKYSDLDGLEAKYTESAFHGAAALPIRRPDDIPFEQMLLEMKKTLNQRKNENTRQDDKP